MHQALYRKYRPKNFDDVCGEDHVTSVLKYESTHSKFSHAYLFCGPRGTGKTSCAKILAKAINCESPINGNPCGKCDACISIDNGTAPDVLEMDAASNNGVDYIREIRDEVAYTPAMLKKRVYIIDEVHMLSIGAFNALLKTLEEPPEHVVFILATTELHKLPATVISRCQRFDFRRIKSDVIAARLLYIANEEHITLDENAARIIAKQSFGGMRDAVSMFELCAAGGQDVTAERVSCILGLTDIEVFYKTAVAVSKNDPASIFSIIKTVESSSKDIAVYWIELTDFWRSMMVFKSLPDDRRRDYLDLTDAEMRVLGDAARRFSKETLTYHFSLLDNAMREMTRLPQTKRLCAELTLIKMSEPSLDSSVPALLSRISSLEEKIALLEYATHFAAESSLTSSQTVAENVKSSCEKTHVTEIAEKSTDDGIDSLSDKTSSEELIPIDDIGDVTERVMKKNPYCGGFFNECNCFITQDKKRIVVRCGNNFAKTVLAKEENIQSMLTAFRMCGISDIRASLSVEVGEVIEKKLPIDELTDL